MLQTYDQRNRDILININTKLIHRDQAGISPFDSAVQGGDAVWEGLRLYNNTIFKLTQHLDRLVSSAKALAFTQIPPPNEIREQIRRTLQANNMHDNVHIRLTLTRGLKLTSGMDPRLNTQGPTLIVIAEHKPPVYKDAAEAGLKLITSSIRRFPPDCMDPKIHHCNLIQSILAKIEANNAGADDAIMLDQRGFIAETNATHLFIVAVSHGYQQPTLLTSPTNACPEGITRQTVLDLCEKHNIACDVKDMTLTEVYRASEVFCTGTMGELVPVAQVDGRQIISPQTDSVTARLQTLYKQFVASSGEPINQ